MPKAGNGLFTRQPAPSPSIRARLSHRGVATLRVDGERLTKWLQRRVRNNNQARMGASGTKGARRKRRPAGAA